MGKKESITVDGDIETRPLIYRDKPAERNLRLLTPVGRLYAEERLEEVAEGVAKLQANEPEIIRATEITMDREKGRLAVGMTVFGDHATLHGRAPEWLAVLHDTDDGSLVGYSWAVGH